ncbi:MAG: tyrosine-type recombinase/integrase [Sulfuricaulis sp.]
MPLTDTRCRNARKKKKSYKLFDADGLFLLVQPTGSKLWRLKYRLDPRADGSKKEHLYAIGVYDDVGLADARLKRDQARKLIAQGVHPTRHRKVERARKAAESVNTFEAVAREWIGKQRSKWTPYYTTQVENMLKANVYPRIGALPIREVSAAQLLEIVQRVEKRAPSVAMLVRQWCSAIFRYAVATLRAETDPAATLKGAIHRPKVQHRAPLQRDEIPKFLKKLDGFAGYRTTIIAMRLLLLTFVRPGELRAAEWSEFDLDNAEWRIPAHKMKMGEQHIVPLPKQAVALLRELRTLTGGQRLLFPNYRRPKTYMTATTINRALERMGYGGRFSSHGFRSTASTLLNEMGWHADVIERQLAHAPRSKVRAAYNRALYIPERKKMMQAWADFIDSLQAGGTVVPIKPRRRTSSH